MSVQRLSVGGALFFCVWVSVVGCFQVRPLVSLPCCSLFLLYAPVSIAMAVKVAVQS
jgi:hypothetical protein